MCLIFLWVKVQISIVPTVFSSDYKIKISTTYPISCQRWKGKISMRVPECQATLNSVNQHDRVSVGHTRVVSHRARFDIISVGESKYWHQHLSQTDTYVWKILSWPSKLKPCLNSIMTYINVIVLEPFLSSLLLIIISSYLPYNRFILLKK